MLRDEYSFLSDCSPPSVIFLFVYMKLKIPLNCRELEEMMHKRKAHIDHSTLKRLAYKFSKFIEKSERSMKKTALGFYNNACSQIQDITLRQNAFDGIE